MVFIYRLPTTIPDLLDHMVFTCCDSCQSNYESGKGSHRIAEKYKKSRPLVEGDMIKARGKTFYILERCHNGHHRLLGYEGASIQESLYQTRINGPMSAIRVFRRPLQLKCSRLDKAEKEIVAAAVKNEQQIEVMRSELVTGFEAEKRAYEAQCDQLAQRRLTECLRIANCKNDQLNAMNEQLSMQSVIIQNNEHERDRSWMEDYRREQAKLNALIQQLREENQQLNAAIDSVFYEDALVTG